MTSGVIPLESSTGLPNVTNSSIWDRYFTELDFYCEFSSSYCSTVKYVPPVWYIVGFPGNMLAFCIWIQPRMRPSSGMYLTALGLADFVFLMLQMIFELYVTWGVNTIKHQGICQLFPIFFYCTQYLNPLLMLAFTVERYIAICHPFHREKFCSTKIAISVSVFLVFFCLAVHAVQGYFWQFIDSKCSVRLEVLEGSSPSVWTVWTGITELLEFGVVPLIILALNMRVIMEVKKIKASEEKIMRMLSGQKVAKPAGASATTVMLLAVSFYMILTTLPVTIMYVLAPLFLPPKQIYLSDDQIRVDSEWQRHITFATIKAIIERLGISHYALNFYIYLATGKVFRQEVRYFLLNVVCRRKGTRVPNTELDDLLATYRKPSTAHSQNGTATHLL